MKKRLMIGLAAGALLAGMVPGVASAAGGPETALVANCEGIGGEASNLPGSYVHCSVPGSIDDNSSIRIGGFLELCTHALPDWQQYFSPSGGTIFLSCTNRVN